MGNDQQNEINSDSEDSFEKEDDDAPYEITKTFK